MPAQELVGVPPGAELWDVDGRVFLVYRIPGTDAFGMWHVEDIEDLQDLVPAGEQPTIDRTLTAAEAAAEGAVEAGRYDDIAGRGEDIIRIYTERLEAFQQIAPAMLDPEILAIQFEAALENTDQATVTAQIQATDWWRSHSQEERDWLTLAMSDPATATRISESNRDTVRNMLWAMWHDSENPPPESLVNRISNLWTSGEITETEMRNMVRAEVDPYAPEASPFAGTSLPEGAELFTDGTNYWVEHEGGAYRLTGPGQVARLGGRDAFTNIAEPTVPENRRAPDGEHLVGPDGKHYLRTPDGNLYLATGPGQLAELERLYGAARPFDYPQHPGVPGPQSQWEEGGVPMPPPTAGTVIGLFREIAGDDTARMEDFAPPGDTGVGETPEFAGEAADILARVGDEGTSALGGEEHVRALLHEWLGPMLAAGYDQQWIAEWAGRIRNNPNAEEQLVNLLRTTFKTYFPQYADNDFATYQSVAAPARSLIQNVWGMEADETDPFFNDLLRMTDDKGNVSYQAMAAALRKEGLQRGVAQVTQDLDKSLLSAFGGQVRQSLV